MKWSIYLERWGAESKGERGINVAVAYSSQRALTRIYWGKRKIWVLRVKEKYYEFMILTEAKRG